MKPTLRIRPYRLALYALLCLVAGSAGYSCRRQYTPKPDGYFRIDPYPDSYRRTTLLEPALSFEVPEGTTLADLLGSEGYDRSRIAVEVDGDICPRADLGSRVIRGGETVEVVSFVGGG